MQRKLVLAIIALIGLGSLAVLGSSPEFIRNMVEAMQSGSVSSIFTASESSGPAAQDVRTGEPSQTKGSPNVSEETLWQIVFTVAQGVVDQEQKVPADQAGLFNNYFTRQGKLSVENDAALKESAAQFIAGMEPLEKRAAPVIEKARAKYKTLAERQKAGPPAELAELQRERSELTLRLRDEFRERIGEEAFADFSEFIKRDLLSGVKSVPLPTEGDQLSPQAFLMFTIIIWDDGLPIPLITGIGGTVVDFFDGFYYDPWVGSELYNWSTGQSLHVGTDRGARWIYPALVFHPVYPTARNQWYCNYTIHYAIDRIIFFKQNGIDPSKMSDLNPLGTDLTAPQDAYYLGELQVCHKVQEQCGSNCQTPTPTPSPSPTPLEVKTVAFDNDYQLNRFPSGTAITDPTWTRGSAANSTNYVAYKKDADNTQLDVVFDVNPPPPSGDSFSMRARAMYNGNVVAETPNNVSVTSSTITLNNLAVNRAVLEPVAQVKKGVYTFTWEVSVDNGTVWRAAGSSEHIIYWLYDAPAAPVSPVNACINDSIPRNCLFVFGQGQLELPGLFDKALEIAIDDLTPATQTPDAIAQFLAAKIDNWVVYDPGPLGGAADVRHPLFIWTESRRAQCSANANLLHGLMRSIGIDSEAIYFWGGEPTNPETGGKVHSYRYRKPSGAEAPVTFRTVRPPKVLGGEDLELNPHFAFHSMVKLNGKYFDPSYGAEPLVGYPYTNISLTEVVTFKNNNPNKPKFKKDAETIPFVVSALNMSTFCSPSPSNSNCSGNSNTIWTPKLCKKHSDKVPKTSVPHAITHFDADELSDVAIWRPSDGSWWVINSSSPTGTNYGTWGLAGDKPAPADFDGDGRTDRTVFRPSNGTWYILKSSDNTWIIRQFGVNGDRPVFGDFDADGRNDIAVWRPADGDWYWLNSSDDSFHGFHFGMNGDVPVSGDYDGNGTTDFMVYRPSNGVWYLHTGTNYTGYTFGLANDIPVSGDFDSDGIDDIALFRPSTAVWYLLQSSDGFTAFQFGDPGDVPSTGDYNNDDGVDAAVWTPSTGRWRVLNLDNGSIITESYWGLSGDIPIPAAYNR